MQCDMAANRVSSPCGVPMLSDVTDLAVVGLGSMGSATAWAATRQGLSVIGFEQFELGHERGASHDTSRSLRHS